MPVFIFQIAGKMNKEDKANIIQFLIEGFYIKQNELLQMEMKWLTLSLYNKNQEIEGLSRLINQRNDRIARLEGDILYYRRLIAQNASIEREHSLAMRTLGFDETDSETDSEVESDDLISLLMGE